MHIIAPMRTMFLLALSLFVWARWAQAQQVQGTVLDETGSPLPHASIQIEGTTSGTLTDQDGRYTLRLAQPGSYVLIYRYIGYKTAQRSLNLAAGENRVLEAIQMVPDPLTLPDIYVTGDGKDPAYGIIKKVKDKRQYYEELLGDHSYQTYVKVRVDQPKLTKEGASTLKKVGGRDAENTDSLNNLPGLLYLAETRSKAYRSPPSGYKEVITDSKVSGQSDMYAAFSSSDLDFDLQRNVIKLDELGSRGGFVSPIGAGAFINYHYKLEGAVQQGEHRLFKISVIPRRQNDPVFSGTLWVVDSAWTVAALDLVLTKERQLISILDTLRIKRQYIPVGPELWLTQQTVMEFKGEILGLAVFKGKRVDFLDSYELKLPVGVDLSKDKEVLRIGDEVVKNDTAYWANRRPVPLDSLERRDYQLKDSLKLRESSPEYLDSLTRTQNKFSVSNLLNRYRYTNYQNNNYLEIKSPLSDLYFNTMEGWNATLTVSKHWNLDKEQKKQIVWHSRLRYGFASQRYLGNTVLLYRQENRRVQGIDRAGYQMGVFGGHYVSEFSGDMVQINHHFNTAYTLIDRQNYLRLYLRTYAGLRYERRLTPLLSLALWSSWEQRNPLVNRTNFSLAAESLRPYQPNLPVQEQTVWKSQINLPIHFNQHYASTPDGRLYLDGGEYNLAFHYQYGTYLAGPAGQFNKLWASWQDVYSLGLQGELHTYATAGTLLDTAGLALPDYQHFRGNQIQLGAGEALSQFGTQDYYSYATGASWAEIHTEYHDNGFLWNKLPLLRKLKWHTLAGIHYLTTNDRGVYSEWSVGLENIGYKFIRPIRVEYRQRLVGEGSRRQQFLLYFQF
jgi:hypothetical protein